NNNFTHLLIESNLFSHIEIVHVFISNVNFTNNANSGITFEAPVNVSLTSIEIIDCNFIHNSNFDEGIINFIGYETSQTLGNINNCKFIENIMTLVSPITLYIENEQIDQTTTFTIENCVFIKNFANYGGAIFLQNGAVH